MNLLYGMNLFSIRYYSNLSISCIFFQCVGWGGGCMQMCSLCRCTCTCVHVPVEATMNLKCRRQVNLLFFLLMSVYVFFCSCIWMCHGGLCGSEDKPLMSDLPFCLHSCPHQTCWHQAFRNSFVPSFYWHYKPVPPGLAFMWDLGIWTRVFMLIQQALFSIKPVFQPLTLLFNLGSLHWQGIWPAG